jgi:hypothetical protein
MSDIKYNRRFVLFARSIVGDFVSFADENVSVKVEGIE